MHRDTKQLKSSTHRRTVPVSKRPLKPRERKSISSGSINSPISSRRNQIEQRRIQHDRQRRIADGEAGSPGAESDDEEVIIQSPQITNRFLEVSQSFEPGTILSQSRRDPFVTYPIAWDPDVDFLFDYLTHHFGAAMFGYTPNSGHDIFYSQANIVLADAAAFHALLIMPAMNRDRITNRSLPSSRTLWHRSEAIRLIKDRLDSEDANECMTEGSMFAVMVLTGIEKQWHGVGVDIGGTGLQRLIIHYGGIEKINQHFPALELALYGLALLTPGMVSPGSPALYNATRPQVDFEQETKLLKAELASFLKATEMKASSPHANGHDLRFALSPGTPMYELLVTPPELSGILQNRMATVQRRLCNSTLLYLHCVILELRSDEESEGFVRSLHSILQKQWIWRNSSRMLQWLIITNGGDSRLARASAAWKAFRLMHAVELLSPETQTRMKEYLIKALSGLPVILSEELSGARRPLVTARAKV